jgi:hypothetical protein
LSLAGSFFSRVTGKKTSPPLLIYSSKEAKAPASSAELHKKEEILHKDERKRPKL